MRGWEVDIIDTNDFQRLRRVKQLGLADLVYPGAVHNRFLHSLGTLHMAQAIIDHVNRNNLGNRQIDEKMEQIIRLVALLHDVGHLPFGHTLEKESNLLKTRHDEWERLKWYVGENTDIGRILGAKGVYKEVTSALSALGDSKVELKVPAYVVDIVGNTICADLLDYLRRDGRACGLNFEYDDRILKYFDIQDSHLVVRLEKNGQYRRDNVSELLSLLGSRYSLTEKVIFHHTKLAASAMLAEAFQLSGLKEENVRRWGQEELLTALIGCTDKPAVCRLSQALLNRQLYKMFFMVPREEAEIEDRLSDLHGQFYQEPHKRALFERNLEKVFGMDEGSIIIYCPEKGMSFKPAHVLVTYRGGMRPIELSKLEVKEIQSEVVSLEAKHKALWSMCLFIDRRYFYLAKEVAEEFKKQMRSKGTTLENALDRRPSPRYSVLLQVGEVLEGFSKEKDLKHSEEQELRRELTLHAPSLRAEKQFVDEGDKQALKDRIRQQAESWYQTRHGEQKL